MLSPRMLYHIFSIVSFFNLCLPLLPLLFLLPPLPRILALLLHLLPLLLRLPSVRILFEPWLPQQPLLVMFWCRLS